MKKLKPHQKAHQLRRSAKELGIRSDRSGPSFTRKHYGSFVLNEWYKQPRIVYVPLTAPTNFTLCHTHCCDVIRYVNEIKAKGKAEQNVNVLLDNIETIDEGAIAMLLSVVNEFTQLKRRIRGTKPKNVQAKAILESSGFFKYFITLIDPQNQNTKNTILRTGTAKTPKTELAKEVHGAMETVWGEQGRCPQLYGGINEMFRNSCEHAFANNEGVVWHLGVSHVEAENKVHFAFVDNGKGIIQTLNTGKLKTVINLFRGNDDILSTAFEDGIESRTGLSWRGKGLPTIHEMFADGIIINLVVITNNVYIDFAAGTKEVLPVSYQGTYYSWEVDQSCVKQTFQLYQDADYQHS